MSVKQKWVIVTFIIAEMLLYVIFMTGDIYGYPKNNTVTILKFFCIILCNVFALLCAISNQVRDNYILLGALFFTGISDYFLLFTDDFTFGMFTFCVVQILYLIRLWYLEEDCRSRRGGIPARLFLNILLWAGICLLFNKFNIEVNLLLIVSVFYFVSILHNVISAVKCAIIKANRKSLIFAAGMILFLLCDINVGIYNMNGFISVGSIAFEKLYHFSEIAMWMFYLPAQVCIALSGNAVQNA